ncbi:hypothetical protein WL22_23735 [Burkholderia ubonensis]|uniref:hypothetical protein n=1 Tax=Burkholderia ubonensis TaxID=101571 RepID=UPI0007564724|nr:hypothetical protein [Burkholderia ubonensis]KVD66867.1 hypothetical protein WI87_29830 [Burkholderia ubonensis]KVP26405.1 hypothetical protein WJ85_34455 [Burkholderia ubonensis]KVZ90474.1 hypothetical protein WL22_23735 [Burkholderia ubonensis]KWB88907.1 hypothetical protein WL44_00260 [Burkholderia ubonensis]OJA62171.1 hypothetical protein BGV68_03960 [Burkholderia ubonensis]
MQIVNATPPAGLPALLIVLDREIAQRHPAKAFYLRVEVENGAKHIDLDGAVTPLDARQLAREKGYEPTHWMVAAEGRPTMF